MWSKVASSLLFKQSLKITDLKLNLNGRLQILPSLLIAVPHREDNSYKIKHFWPADPVPSKQDFEMNCFICYIM